MKRSDAGIIDNVETRNSMSHIQAAESLHEISVNTPTLRDQFAMSALQGLLVNNWRSEMGDELFTQRAYRLADAMLEARK